MSVGRRAGPDLDPDPDLDLDLELPAAAAQEAGEQAEGRQPVYTYRDLAQLARADVRARLRVVGHCDLDCAFAQFEAQRLGWDVSAEPVAVEQWGSLLAVSYPARAAGVSRMTTVAAARAACPGLRVAHVATYAPGDRRPAHHAHPDPRTHKVSLDAYRRIGKAVAASFRARSGAEIQRAGTDEAYFDLSRPVHARLCQRFPELAAGVRQAKLSGDERLPPPPRELDWTGCGAVLFPPDPATSSTSTTTTTQIKTHGQTNKSADPVSESEPEPEPESDSENESGPAHDPDLGLEDAYQSKATPPDHSKCAPQASSPLPPEPNSKHKPVSTSEVSGAHQNSASAPSDPAAAAAAGGHASEPHPFISSRGSGPRGEVTWGDVAIWLGAQIMAEVRSGVRGDPELGYTTSAGVSQNKTLAKLGSSHRKPNGQTAVLPGAMGPFIGSHLVRKVPCLKGKLGQALCDELGGVEYVHELTGLSEEQLGRAWTRVAVAGPMDSAWLYLLLRGVDYAPIVTEPASRSMMASKSFRPPLRCHVAQTHAEIASWRYTLVSELCLRLTEARQEQESSTLTPTALVMRAAVRSRTSTGTAPPTPAQFRSHQVPVGVAPSLEEIPPEPLLVPAQKLWESMEKDMPSGEKTAAEITHLSLHFAGLHAPSSGQKSLQSFFLSASGAPAGGASTKAVPVPVTVSVSIPAPALAPAPSPAPAPAPAPAPTLSPVAVVAPNLDEDFFASDHTDSELGGHTDCTASCTASTNTRLENEVRAGVKRGRSDSSSCVSASPSDSERDHASSPDDETVAGWVSWTCPTCGETLSQPVEPGPGGQWAARHFLEREKTSHGDFHFAEQLQQAEEAQPQEAQRSSNSSSNSCNSNTSTNNTSTNTTRRPKRRRQAPGRPTATLQTFWRT